MVRERFVHLLAAWGCLSDSRDEEACTSRLPSTVALALCIFQARKTVPNREWMLRRQP
jgi:hypothetical protein